MIVQCTIYSNMSDTFEGSLDTKARLTQMGVKTIRWQTSTHVKGHTNLHTWLCKIDDESMLSALRLVCENVSTEYHDRLVSKRKSLIHELTLVNNELDGNNYQSR